MSDQLKVSAAFSVLIMSAYVLLGGDAVRAPIGPGSLQVPGIEAPGPLIDPGRPFVLAN